jgi:hypothetical protein
MRFLQRFRMVHRFASFPAKVLLNPESNNAAKPGTQLRRLAQLPEMLPRRDECLLRDIRALAQIAKPTVGQRADQGLVARHNAAECLAVAG